MASLIENIIDEILERTDGRWFLRIYENRLEFPIASPIKRYEANEYSALFMQMLLTMINPHEVLRLNLRKLLNLIIDIEKTSIPIRIRRYEEILYKFIMYYISKNLISWKKFNKYRYDGPIVESDSKVTAADLVRAHYWLLKRVQGQRLPGTTYYIIGAGGVGWWVAEFVNMFARNSKIVVYDFDSIEPHNFNRLPLSYLVLIEKDDLRKALLLREKLQPVAEMNNNELITIPTAFTERQLEGLKKDAGNVDQLFFIEATDSPRFQLWIRKAIKQLGKDNVWLLQGHYDTKYPNMWGHVEAYPPEMIPVPRQQEIEQASDYAEGQSIGLPPFLVADVIRLLIMNITQNDGRKTYEFGPFILTEQQLNAYYESKIIL